MVDGNKGGRPRQGASTKLAPLNMRTDPLLRERIEEAANQTGRSLTQEVERRLRTSFFLDEYIGGAHIRSLVHMLGAAINGIEMRTGKRWIDDEATWRAVQEAAKKLIAWDRPATPATDSITNQSKLIVELDAKTKEAKASLVEFRSVRAPCSSFASNNALNMVHLESQDPIGADQDEWTSEDKKEEIALLAKWEKARTAYLLELISSKHKLDEWGDSIQSAKEIGLSQAKDIFDLIGPRRSTE